LAQAWRIIRAGTGKIFVLTIYDCCVKNFKQGDYKCMQKKSFGLTGNN
jgi:hypothetical protein